MTKELESLAAGFVQKNAEITDAFVEASTNPNLDVARMMSKFFNDSIALGQEHDEKAMELRLSLVDSLPPKVRSAGMPLSVLLWPKPLRAPSLNYSAFRMTEDSGVCGQVRLFNKAIDDFGDDLYFIHQTLNYTTYLLPQLPKQALPETLDDSASAF